MKITFVALGSEQLAISLLANMAKSRGHEVGLAFSASLFHDRFNLEIPTLNRIFDDSDQAIRAIEEQEPDVLVCSVLTATYQWMLTIAGKAKAIFPDLKVVFGGVHVSAVPDRVLKHKQIDYVVVGEGEVAFPAILDALERRDYQTPIPNTRYKASDGSIIQGEQRGFYQELDSLPPFSKELWEPHIYVADQYMTMASRGCPYRCTFCFNNFFTELPDNKATRGKYVRHRSVGHMLDELRHARERYGNIRLIDFEDDVFTTDRNWLKEFLARYKEEIDVPFQCLTHPRYMDQEIATMLKEAGCTWIQMGIQTMDEDLKTGSLRRNERSDHIRQSLKVMTEAGLKVKVDHMFGLPGESLESQETARALYAEHCPARIQTFWTCFLPGTELLEQGLQSGLVTEDEAERLNEGIDFYFFRNAENIKNPGLVRTYQGYELLFKAYPLLPRFVRRRLKEKHVRWIPTLAKRLLGTGCDILNALKHRNPDFLAYMRFYILHLTRFMLRKLGLRNKIPATRIQKNARHADLEPYRPVLEPETEPALGLGIQKTRK